MPNLPTEKSLTLKTFRNATYSFFNYFTAVLISIFLTPFLLKYLGEQGYGFYTLILTLLGFFGLAEASLSWYTIRKIALDHAQHDVTDLNVMLSSIKWIYRLLAVVGLWLFLLLGFFHHRIFVHIFYNFEVKVFLVFALAGCYHFVRTANSIYLITPPALQRFDLAAKFSILQIILTNLIFVVLLLSHFGIVSLMVVNVGSVLFLALVFRYQFKRLLPHVSVKANISRATIFNSVSFSLFAVVNVLLFSDLARLDKLIIPAVTNAQQLAFYTLPNTIAQKILIFIASLATVLFPLISALIGQGELVLIKHLYRKAVRLLMVFGSALTCTLVAYANKILHIWLGKQLSPDSSRVLVSLCFSYLILAQVNILYNFLIGLNRVKVVAVSGLTIIFFSFVLLLILVPRQGIIGAGHAWLLTVLLTVPGLSYFCEKKILGLAGIGRFYFKLLSKITLTFAVTWLTIKLVFLPKTQGLLALLVGMLGSFVLFLAIYGACRFFEKEDTEIIFSFFSKIKTKWVGAAL